MFVPTEDLIIGKGPTAGYFYRRASSTGTTVAQIAYVSAWKLRQAGHDVSTFQMVQMIANSPWNAAHIRYARKGYENYGFDGPQMEKKYAHDPVSAYGSGTGWPTFWIPTYDGKEPGQVYGPTAPPPMLEKAPTAPPSARTPLPESRTPSPLHREPPYPGGVGSPSYDPGMSRVPGGVGGGLTRRTPGGVALAGFSPWLLLGLVAVAGVVIWQATKKKKRKK